MRIKPALKSASVSANGRFPPEAAIPETLADMGILDRWTARQAVVRHQSENLAWFTAEGMTVEVLPGTFRFVPPAVRDCPGCLFPSDPGTSGRLRLRAPVRAHDPVPGAAVVRLASDGGSSGGRVRLVA